MPARCALRECSWGGTAKSWPRAGCGRTGAALGCLRGCRRIGVGGNTPLASCAARGHGTLVLFAPASARRQSTFVAHRTCMYRVRSAWPPRTRCQSVSCRTMHRVRSAWPPRTRCQSVRAVERAIVVTHLAVAPALGHCGCSCCSLGERAALSGCCARSATSKSLPAAVEHACSVIDASHSSGSFSLRPSCMLEASSLNPVCPGLSGAGFAARVPGTLGMAAAYPVPAGLPAVTGRHAAVHPVLQSARWKLRPGGLVPIVCRSSSLGFVFRYARHGRRAPSVLRRRWAERTIRPAGGRIHAPVMCGQVLTLSRDFFTQATDYTRPAGSRCSAASAVCRSPSVGAQGRAAGGTVAARRAVEWGGLHKGGRFGGSDPVHLPTAMRICAEGEGEGGGGEGGRARAVEARAAEARAARRGTGHQTSQAHGRQEPRQRTQAERRRR